LTEGETELAKEELEHKNLQMLGKFPEKKWNDLNGYGKVMMASGRARRTPEWGCYYFRVGEVG
jgi:hypothetical protein